MPSSAPGATFQQTPAETQQGASVALGVFGGLIGAAMALVFFALTALGSVVAADAGRSEETAVMAATLGLLLLSVLGAIGAVTVRSAPGRGAALQALAAFGGIGVLAMAALLDLAGQRGGDTSYLTDALWLVVGFWSIPALLFAAGAALARTRPSPI